MKCFRLKIKFWNVVWVEYALGIIIKELKIGVFSLGLFISPSLEPLWVSFSQINFRPSKIPP